jgi:PAS domain S-box-containing protein
MTDTVILSRAGTGSATAPTAERTAWRAVLLAGIILAVCLGVLACILPPKNSAGGKSDALDFRVWRAGYVAVAGIGAALLAVSFGLTSWERSWSQRLKTVESEWRSRTGALERQTADSRKAEELVCEELEAARVQLTRTSDRCSALQFELDERKKAEKTFSRQRELLESSKTVLEMHVEARTRQLQTLQNRYELILNSAGEGICGMDREGKAAFVNPAVLRMTGWIREDVIGKSEQEIFYPDDTNGSVDSTENCSGEHVFRRKDGSRFSVEFIRTGIEEEGRQTGSVLIFKTSPSANEERKLFRKRPPS